MGDSGAFEMNDTGSIFLLAENRLLRETLSRLLRKKSSMSIVGKSSHTGDAVQQVAASGCEILLLDSETATRTKSNLIREMLAAVPNLKIILIGVDDKEENFLRAVRSGVVGYLLEEASAMDVVAAVRTVARGEAACPPQLTLALFRHIARQNGEVSDRRARAKIGLTRRQHQLVALVAEGWTNKEIASTLNLSEQTVKNHMHRILRQVKAVDRYGAVEAVRACGLLV